MVDDLSVTREGDTLVIHIPDWEADAKREREDARRGLGTRQPEDRRPD